MVDQLERLRTIADGRKEHLQMSFVVNSGTEYLPLALSLVIMLVMSALLLVWARRKGWW